jgi:3-oxoacyl-[acyl-carrier-protein] synthase III
MFVVPLAQRLGSPVPIAELADSRVRENLAALVDQGITTARVSEETTSALAAAVTPADADIDTIIACTDTGEAPSPTDWLLDYRSRTGHHATRALLVGGSACANLITAWDLASSLVRSRAARRVLVVTADRVSSGTRHPPSSMTVCSDGAASCLVTAEPTGPAFALLGTATRSWRVGTAVNEMAYARRILTTTRSVVTDLTSPDRVTHLLTPNFGSATRNLLAMAASFPTYRLDPGVAPDVGHCFAADTLLNLEDLRRRGALADGDSVLALMSSSAIMSGALLAYRA